MGYSRAGRNENTPRQAEPRGRGLISRQKRTFGIRRAKPASSFLREAPSQDRKLVHCSNIDCYIAPSLLGIIFTPRALQLALASAPWTVPLDRRAPIPLKDFSNYLSSPGVPEDEP